MINKNDCMTVLVNLEKERNINVNSYLKKLLISAEPPLEVLKFISDNHGSDITNFYEMLRKNHNSKKSPLYVNIVRSDGSDGTEAVLTLTCLLTQIVLYSKKLEHSEIFLREARAEEITRVLNAYFSSDSADKCVALLKLIKSDLLVLEYIAGRRNLETA